jgi:hypothetical protein
LIVYGFIAVAVFVVTTPQVVLHLGEYRDFMMNQKSQWYDKAPDSMLAVLLEWFDSTSWAVGASVTVTSLFGLSVRGGAYRSSYSLPIAFVASYYLFWRGYLPPRFVIVVAPFLCIWSAAFFARLVQNKQKALRTLGVVLVTAVIVWSGATCVMGIMQRRLDSRTEASRYIDQHIPSGSRIGIATDHNYPWVHHNWRYPYIDFSRYEDTHFLQMPKYLVVTSLELEVMRAALRSENLLPEYRWNANANRQWYLSEPPDPAIFEFYEKLLAGETYDLITAFAPPIRLDIDGAAPTVYLFQTKESGVTGGRGPLMNANGR